MTESIVQQWCEQAHLMPAYESVYLLAQTPDWIEGLIFLAIVVFSVLGSLGKWIVQKIEQRREEVAKQRERFSGSGDASMRTPSRSETPGGKQPSIPPFAAPMGPLLPRRKADGRSAHPPVMERILEVLTEQATAKKKSRERHSETTTNRPPPPPVRSKKPAMRPAAKPVAPPESVAQRADAQDRARANAVELEAQRVAMREQKWNEETQRRLGHVTTHIPTANAEDALFEAIDFAEAFDNPAALRRAFVLSEILSPPRALREL